MPGLVAQSPTIWFKKQSEKIKQKSSRSRYLQSRWTKRTVW